MREFIAGLSTFGAMAYILAVNPAIMATAGLDRHDMVMTTIAAAAFGTLLMALFANLPIALAPTMSSNIVFAQIVVVHMGIAPRVAFAAVFLSGLIFTLLSLTQWRQKIVLGFPEPIAHGIRFAIGAFIARIGMTTGGLAVPSHEGLTFGSLANASTQLVAAGLLATALLMRLRIPAAMLIVILALTVAGCFLHKPDGDVIMHLPARIVEWPTYPAHLLFPFDFGGLLTELPIILPILAYFFLSDFFDATGTMMAVTQQAQLAREDGRIVPGRAAFVSDGIASVVGATLGTCTVSAYLESLVGVEAGGRTGLSSVVVGVLFGLSAFFWPLITAIPAIATAPALMIVGLNMLAGLTSLPRKTTDDVLPPILMVLVTVMTGNFMVSLAFGLLLYTGLIIVTRRWQRLTPMLIGLDMVFSVFLILESQIQGR
ncbi:NCS2 family permease [Gluconacetobacter asukensis]